MGNAISSVLSRKRPSPESSDDEKTKGVSWSVFQRGDNAKRVKLWTSSDALLQSLPIELIEFILVKAVATEVMEMKLAKSVWKEKADIVINRLSTVSPQWTNILTSNFFRNELHRTLDRTAERKIRLEILHQFPLQSYVTSITTTKDEIFLLCIPKDEEIEESMAIHVYDRDNMVEVKDVIPLPENLEVHSIVACRVSNSIYVLSEEIISYTVWRITKDDHGQFNMLPIISDLHMPYGSLSERLSVTANGGLILSTFDLTGIAVSMYNANGSLQHHIWSSQERPTPYGMITKSNGNLVVVSSNDRHRTKLIEINMSGNVLRQYQSSFFILCNLRQIDKYGRMWLTDYHDTVQLLDSEFNPLGSTFSLLNKDKALVPHRLHYNSERDELVTVVGDDLTICRFTDY